MEFGKAYFDAGINRIGTDSVKWDGMMAENGDPDMIPMWIADMDFPSPPAVQTALEKVASNGTWGYTVCGEADTKALCAYWERRHGLKIDKDTVVMMPCVVTGLRMAIRAMTEPGDGVLITPPVYGPFFDAIKSNGRKLVESPLTQDESGRYSFNFKDMEGRLASREAKAVMICSPHNPCGRAWTKEELTEVVEMCRRYGVPLICDEIHADFVFAPNEHHSILTIPGAADFTIMCCAASKTFNVAGLEQSMLVCPNETIRKKIEEDMNASGVKAGNVFALAATRAAYTDCDAWLDGLKAYLMENRDFVVKFAAEHMPKVKVTPLDATYLMWLDCRALGMEQQQMLDALLKAHVRVNDGLFFGEYGRGFIRLNIGCPRAQLEAALTKMASVLG